MNTGRINQNVSLSLSHSLMACRQPTSCCFFFFFFFFPLGKRIVVVARLLPDD